MEAAVLGRGTRADHLWHWPLSPATGHRAQGLHSARAIRLARRQGHTATIVSGPYGYAWAVCSHPCALVPRFTRRITELPSREIRRSGRRAWPDWTASRPHYCGTKSETATGAKGTGCLLPVRRFFDWQRDISLNFKLL